MTESGDYLKRKHPIQPDIKGTFKKLKTPAELNVIAQSSSSSDNMKSSMAICTELEKHESNNSIGQKDILFKFYFLTIIASIMLIFKEQAWNY